MITYATRNTYQSIFSEPRTPYKTNDIHTKLQQKKKKPVFMDLRTDYCLKTVLAEDGGEVVMSHLLNAFLEPAKPIKPVIYENVEKQPELKSGKRNYYDVGCKLETGEKVMVEMQRNKQEDFIERLMAYASRKVVNQLRAGQQYTFNAVTVLSFVDFALSPRPTDDYHHTIDTVWKNSTLKLIRKPVIHVVELKRFNKRIDELVTMKDKWMFLFKHLGKLKSIPAIFDNNIFRPVFERARFNNLNENEQMEYFAEMDHDRDIKNQLAYSEKRGERRGERRGEKRGEKRGRVEERKEVVINLLNKDFSVESIAELLNFSVEMIEKIKAELPLKEIVH